VFQRVRPLREVNVWGLCVDAQALGAQVRRVSTGGARAFGRGSSGAGATRPVAAAGRARGIGSGAHATPFVGRPGPAVRHCGQCVGWEAGAESDVSCGRADTPATATARGEGLTESLKDARHTDAAGDGPRMCRSADGAINHWAPTSSITNHQPQGGSHP
jgi:hypothetical protein